MFFHLCFLILYDKCVKTLGFVIVYPTVYIGNHIPFYHVFLYCYCLPGIPWKPHPFSMFLSIVIVYPTMYIGNHIPFVGIVVYRTLPSWIIYIGKGPRARVISSPISKEPRPHSIVLSNTRALMVISCPYSGLVT